AVAALADRTQLYLAARTVLPWHQPERSGEVPAAAEDRRIDHDCCHGTRQDRPIAGRGDQMPAGRVAAPPVHDLLVNALELSLEATQHLRHSSQSVLQQCWNPVLLGIGQDR